MTACYFWFDHVGTFYRVPIIRINCIDLSTLSTRPGTGKNKMAAVADYENHDLNITVDLMHLHSLNKPLML